jgi:hypothetical protein
MTGWRSVTPQPTRRCKKMSNYLSHSTGSPGTKCQWAPGSHNRSQDGVEAMRKVLKCGEIILSREINDIPNIFVYCRKVRFKL